MTKKMAAFPLWVRAWWPLLALALIGACAVVGLVWAPACFVNVSWPEDKDNVEATAARLRAEADARQTVLWMSGGAIAVVTLIFTWQRDLVNRDRVNLDRDRVNLDRDRADLDGKRAELERDANFTTRYTEAISQLGHEDATIRIGGIYALERTATESGLDRQTILNVLCAYLRLNSPPISGPHPDLRNLPPLAIDTAAAATVVGRITQRSVPSIPVDLQYTNLFKAYLTGAKLRDATLHSADLPLADLSGADLREAKLRGADLREANLRGADLRSAKLSYADLRSARLHGADLRGADLRGAKLRRTRLSGTKYSPTTTWPDGFTAPSTAVLMEDEPES